MTMTTGISTAPLTSGAEQEIYYKNKTKNNFLKVKIIQGHLRSKARVPIKSPSVQMVVYKTMINKSENKSFSIDNKCGFSCIYQVLEYALILRQCKLLLCSVIQPVNQINFLHVN